MTTKPVVSRELAKQDVEEAIDHYADEAGEDLSLRFIDALSEAYRAIGSRPRTGSPRYAQELDLPGLRCRELRRFPYLVFYLERDDHVDVWRVLHAQRDIPVWMAE